MVLCSPLALQIRTFANPVSLENALRTVPRDTLSHALEGVLRRDAGLRAETFQYYKPRIESAARQMDQLRAAAAGPDDGFIQFSF